MAQTPCARSISHIDTPKVSVVIPAYNHAPYVAQTISSILAQTWRDFEIIVVDDGSTDETPQIIAQFGDQIRYVWQANRGIAAARNTGIRQARGEFISFLDDDDLWAPDYLETVVPVLEQDPDTMAVHTGWQAIDEKGRPLSRRSVRVVPPDQLFDALLVGGFFTGACVTVRKTCLDRVGPLDEMLQGCDDLDLWLRISRVHTFKGIPEALVLYRMHGAGLSSNEVHMFRDRLRVLTKHFGPDEGDPLAWSEEKRRAFGFAYRSGAIGHIHQGQLDEGWRLLAQAVEIYPHLLGRLDTFYELALGDQPRGYRGQADLLDIEGNGARMLKRLDCLFAEVGPAVESLRRSAYGNAYLALAMLSDQAGQWEPARSCMLRAICAYPALVRQPGLVRRLAKLFAGKGVVNWLLRVMPHTDRQSPTESEA
ncbi:MAG: glycosyltransferase family 2 protein [bacterium]